MVNTPIFPMFQKSSSMANNNATDHGQTVDLAAAKSNNLYGGGTNVPRLDGLEKFRRSSTGHIHHGSSGSGSSVNNSVTNNDVHGDDGDLISNQHAPGVGRVPSASSRSGGGVLRNGGDSKNSGYFDRSEDSSRAMVATHQQTALAGLGMGGFNLGLTSSTLGMYAKAQHGVTWRKLHS